MKYITVPESDWLRHHTVTVEITGSNPVGIAKLLRDELYYEEVDQLEDIAGFIDMIFVSLSITHKSEKFTKSVDKGLIPSHYDDNDEDNIYLHFRDKD